MSLPDLLLNVRVKPPIKDSLQVHAGRIGKKLGPLMRDWVTERLVTELALRTFRTVGLIELQRRLAQPSPVFAYHHDNTEGPDGVEQTEANIVLRGAAGVLR